MSLVDQLKNVISEQKFGSKDPDAWIKWWLFENEMNRGRHIPSNAPVTLIKGLRILFEFPWQAVCEAADAVGSTKDNPTNLAAYVCVNDSGMTEVLVIDIITGKVVHFWRKEAWKFRFKKVKELESWMEQQVFAILKAIGKEDKWRRSPLKKRV